MTTPCTSAYVPWYLGQLNVPKPYATGTNKVKINSAYWAFRTLSETVNARYGEKIGPVRSLWSNFEVQEVTDQIQLEKDALALYQRDPAAARKMLTKFSDARAAEVLKLVPPGRIGMLPLPSTADSH